jgi:ArsR family transcriptional regulator
MLIFTMTTIAVVPAWTAFERHAKLFHALSDPRRLRIIDLLRGGERCVCDLQSDLECAQSLLSFHLKALRDAGLVTARKDGRWIYYALVIDGLHHAEEVIGALGRPKSVLRHLPVRCCG